MQAVSSMTTIAAGAEQRARLLQRVVIHAHLHRCSAVSTGIETPPGMIALSGRPAANAAGVLEDDLAQRRAERQLVHAGRTHVAADAEEGVAGALLGADRA